MTTRFEIILRVANGAIALPALHVTTKGLIQNSKHLWHQINDGAWHQHLHESKLMQAVDSKLRLAAHRSALSTNTGSSSMVALMMTCCKWVRQGARLAGASCMNQDVIWSMMASCGLLAALGPGWPSLLVAMDLRSPGGRVNLVGPESCGSVRPTSWGHIWPASCGCVWPASCGCAHPASCGSMRPAFCASVRPASCGPARPSSSTYTHPAGACPDCQYPSGMMPQFLFRFECILLVQ